MLSITFGRRALDVNANRVNVKGSESECIPGLQNEAFQTHSPSYREKMNESYLKSFFYKRTIENVNRLISERYNMFPTKNFLLYWNDQFLIFRLSYIFCYFLSTYFVSTS